MKSNVFIALLTLTWLVLIADIIWKGTDGNWRIEDAEKIGELEVAQYTNQIIVVAISDEEAILCLYERNLTDGQLREDMLEETKDKVHGQESMRWELVFETEAVIGKNGLGKTKEGDGKTPAGVFLFTKAFGILENPGTKFEYVQVDERHYWVDDSRSKYYNQLVDIKNVVPDWKSAEHILEYGECYHYVLATSFNVEKIPGAGSAVFLHCVSDDADATAGCIAIPEVYMREIIMRVEQQCILIVDKAENISLY